MKRFRVKFRNPDGESAFKEIEANSKEEAEGVIRLQGLWPEEILEETSRKSWFFQIGAGVSTVELFHFTRLFATLSKAGVPLLEGLTLLAHRSRHATLKKTLSAIVSDISGGSGLSKAFEGHPQVFDGTFLNLIKIGEESGELFQVLNRLAGLLDRKIRLRRMIKKAVAYPSLVIIIASLVTYGILTQIVPRFKAIYSRFGGELPRLTQFTISCSDALILHAPAILFWGCAAIIIIFLLRKISFGKRLLDRIAMRIPLIGPMYHTYEIAQFAKSFSVLIHSGFTVISSLDILTPTIERLPIRDSFENATLQIRNGTTIGESFKAQEPMLPDLFNHMVLIGEKTGNMTEMLDHISDFYEEEFNNSVETLSLLIEPLMIVFLGVVIGGIVISLYLPIFGLAKLITKR